MSCPAITNKGGKLSISRFPVACELTLSELALLDYAVVPGVGSIGDTGIEQDITSYSTVNAGISPQSKAAAVGKAWDVEMIESQSAARDVFETASAVANKDTYATRIEWPDGAVEFSIVQVSSPTYVKGAPSGVRIVRYTMIPSFIPIVTNSLPVASNVAIGGIPFIGATLAATYSYYSPLGLPEAGTAYQWYADGVAIPGETSTSLLLTGDHIGANVTFGVTPSDGLSYGHEVISGPVGPIADSARFAADAGLYTDTALTVPVTSYGNAVAGWDGGVLVGVQPTLTARAAYGRMPVSGVANLLTDSENISGMGWAGSGVTTPDFETIITDSGVGLNTSYLRTSNIAKPAAPLQYSAQVEVESAGFNQAAVFINESANAANRFNALVDLTSGAVINSSEAGTFSDGSVNVTPLGAGRYLIQITCTTGSESAIQMRVGARDSVATMGNGVDGIKVTRLQLNQGGPKDYQRVGVGPYDVTESGVPDTPILYYDLGDDVLPQDMDLPAITGGTLVIAGEDGIWIDDNFNHAGGSWSLGPTTYTGGPAGLLPSLIGNRVLGFAVFAGQLSPAELEVEVTDWMAKGAPGVWEGSGSDLGTYTLNTDPYP